jgi:hypothetical protein
MALRFGLGRLGQASMMACRSESTAALDGPGSALPEVAFGAPSVPDSVPRDFESGGFSGGFDISSRPTAPI